MDKTIIIDLEMEQIAELALAAHARDITLNQLINELLVKHVADVQSAPDLTKCPNCLGPADNGHDRCVPPNPYFCTKCSDLANI